MFAQVDCDGLLEIRSLTKPVKQSAARRWFQRSAAAEVPKPPTGRQRYNSWMITQVDHRVTGRHLMP